ncbi:MAG: hypothetical protein ACRCXL_08945 [Dermatophilaceae bacterium]
MCADQFDSRITFCKSSIEGREPGLSGPCQGQQVAVGDLAMAADAGQVDIRPAVANQRWAAGANS